MTGLNQSIHYYGQNNFMILSQLSKMWLVDPDINRQLIGIVYGIWNLDWYCPFILCWLFKKKQSLIFSPCWSRYLLESLASSPSTWREHIWSWALLQLIWGGKESADSMAQSADPMVDSADKWQYIFRFLQNQWHYLQIHLLDIACTLTSLISTLHD